LGAVSASFIPVSSPTPAPVPRSPHHSGAQEGTTSQAGGFIPTPSSSSQRPPLHPHPRLSSGAEHTTPRRPCPFLARVVQGLRQSRRGGRGFRPPDLTPRPPLPSPHLPPGEGAP